MKTIIKKTLMIIGAIVVLLWLFQMFRVDAATSADAVSCPTGTYQIGTDDSGNPICKNEPTGCPYGDSIPLGPECDKHAPVSAPVVTEEQKQSTPIESAPVENWGK